MNYEIEYDLVNFQDHLVKTGTKEDAKKMKLFTRSIHILLFNKKGEIMICKSPANKKTYSNLITSSSGGHVEQGETYKIAAKRELREELNIKISLKDLGRFDVITANERAIHHLFIGKSNKKVSVDPNEISRYYFLSAKNIKNNINLHPRKYAKPFIEAFKYYLKYSKKL